MENLANGVFKENRGARDHRDQEGGKDHREFLDKKAWWGLREILGFQGQAVQKEKLDQKE